MKVGQYKGEAAVWKRQGLQRWLLILTSLGVMSAFLACSDRKSESTSEPKKAEEPAAAAPAVAADVAAPENGGVDELKWQDTLRLLETGAAFLVLEASSQADSSALKNQRQSIAKAMGLSTTSDQEFTKSLLTAMRNDLKQYEGTAMGAATQQLELVLAAQLGESDKSSLGKAARSLRPMSQLAHIGALLELAHSAKAVQSGLGFKGSAAHGVSNALSCPSAAWLEPSLAVAIQTNARFPKDIDVMAELKECLGYCSGVSEAQDFSSLLVALSSCKRIHLPRPTAEIASSIALLNALSVGELLDARQRVAEVRWVIAKDLPDAALAALDSMIQGAKLKADFVPSVTLASYPYLSGQSKQLSYLLSLGPDGYVFSQWPMLSIKDGKLSKLVEHSRAVEIGVPTSLRPVLMPELESTVGILLPPETPVSELRAVLKALRSIGIEERYLAVSNEQGALWWLSVESNPTAVADVLIQQSANLVSVWANAGAVSEAAIDTLPAETSQWPGQLTRLQFLDAFRETLPVVHDALAATPVHKLLLDPEDSLSISELLELVTVIDYPRRLKISKAEELLAAPTVTPDEKRIETVYLTEFRARALPLGPQRERVGVGLPLAFEVAISGSLSVDKVLEKLETLRGPLQNCYDREALERPGLSGIISVELDIDAPGSVVGVKVLSNATGSELLQACVEDGMPMLSFDALAGGEGAKAVFPLYFDPPAP
ncbi:MAG: AgmX/PglI C-terminal domain-containing protein [Myxococcota bacterium]|jgi:hypothetical protein|nr:AgmX/PglI C-terminal domain-containing protein [Myxococcota bacterium]